MTVSSATTAPIPRTHSQESTIAAVIVVVIIATMLAVVIGLVVTLVIYRRRIKRKRTAVISNDRLNELKNPVYSAAGMYSIYCQIEDKTYIY